MASYYSQLEASIKASESEISRLQKALSELQETKKASPQDGLETALSQEEIKERISKEEDYLETKRETLANYNTAARNIYDLRKLRDEEFKTPELDELRALLKEETDPRIRIEIEAELSELEKNVSRQREIFEKEKEQKIAQKEEAVRTSIALLSDELAQELRESFLNGEMDNLETETEQEENKQEEPQVQITDQRQASLQQSWNEANDDYQAAQRRLEDSIKSFQSIFDEERRIREDDVFKTEEELDSFTDEYMRLKIKENENYEMSQREMKNAEKRMNSLERRMREYATLVERAKEFSLDVESFEKIRRVVEDKKTLTAIYESRGLGEVTRRTKVGKEQARQVSDETIRRVIEQLRNDGIIVTENSTGVIEREQIKNDVINSINVIYGTDIATRTSSPRKIKMTEEKKELVEEKQRIKVKVRKVPRNGIQQNNNPGPAPRGIPFERNNVTPETTDDKEKQLVKEDQFEDLRERFPKVEPFTEVKERKRPEIRITEPPVVDQQPSTEEKDEDQFEDLRERFPKVEPFTEVKERKRPEIRITEPPVVDQQPPTEEDEDQFKDLRERFPKVEPFKKVERRIAPPPEKMALPPSMTERKIVDDVEVAEEIKNALSKVKITEEDKKPIIEKLQEDEKTTEKQDEKSTQPATTTKDPKQDEQEKTADKQQDDQSKKNTEKKEEQVKEEKAEEKEQKPRKQKKGLITIIDELTEDIEIGRKDGKRYQASNVRVMKSFKEELSSGNMLYNIVRIVPAIVRVPINLLRKISAKIMMREEAKLAVTQLRERLNNLGEEDLMTIYQEYRSNRVIQERFPTLLNTMINERMQSFVLGKVTKINSELEYRYRNAYGAIKKIEAIDQQLTSSKIDEDTKRNLVAERQKILSGQAENIASIRRGYVESNNWLSGGTHGFSEDMKAAATKLSIIGKRFAIDHDLDKDLLRKQAQLERAEMQAIANGDNEMALRVFVQAESLLSTNTEIKGSIFGRRSTGKKYYSPLAEQLDYRNDPFVRDIFTTIALVSAAIGTTSSLTTEEKNVELLNEQSAAIRKNEEIMQQVHETGSKITEGTDSFIEGLKYRTTQDTLTASGVVERGALDAHDWAINSAEYSAADQTAHSFYESFYDSTAASLEKIATEYAAGTITQEQALKLMTEISSNTQSTLTKVTEECLTVLNQYAPVHKQFDLDGVQEAMTYLVENPSAISKMNQAALDITKAGETLKGLEFEHVATIKALPLNIQEQLMSYAATAALAVNVTETMQENTKKHTYGNVVTDMVDEYVVSHQNQPESPKTNKKN